VREKRTIRKRIAPTVRTAVHFDPETTLRS